MADSNSIVGSIGLDASAIVSALQQTVAQVNAAGAASTKLNVTINNVTKTTAANAVATMQQVNALKVQTAQSNAAAAAHRANTAAINAQNAALRNFSATSRATGGPATKVNPAFIAGAAGAGAGAQKNFQAGNAAMQIQDVAVSLQGGMSLAQVIGQQGSQLLSIFGPSGMLVGGAVAVGAALWTAADKSAEGFKRLHGEAKEVNAQLRAIADFGTGETLWAGLDKATEGVDELATEFERLNKPVTRFFEGAGAALLGEDLPWERQLKLAGDLSERELERGSIVKSILSDLEKDNEILRVRLTGNKDLADAMERQKEYASEIARIESRKDLTQDQKDAMTDKISEKENLEYQIRRNKEISAEAKKRKDAIAKENEDIKEAAEKYNEAKQSRIDASKKELSIEAQIEESAKRSQELREKASTQKPKQAYETKAAAEKEDERRIRLEQKMREDDEKAKQKNREEIETINAGLQKRFGQIRENENKEAEAQDREAKAQQDKIAVMEVEITKGKTAAQNLSERLKIEQDIRKAREDGNKELEAGLQKEKQLLEVKDAIAEQLKTPEQKKAERDKAAEERKAARIVASRARRLAQAAANAGFGGEVKPKDKAAGVPNLNPNAPAAGAAGAAAGNQMKVDTLVVKVLKHG